MLGFVFGETNRDNDRALTSAGVNKSLRFPLSLFLPSFYETKYFLESWCHKPQTPSYQTSGYPFISVAMYAIHALIILSRPRFTLLKAMGEGRSEKGDPENIYIGSIRHIQQHCKSHFWAQVLTRKMRI